MGIVTVITVSTLARRDRLPSDTTTGSAVAASVAWIEDQVDQGRREPQVQRFAGGGPLVRRVAVAVRERAGPDHAVHALGVLTGQPCDQVRSPVAAMVDPDAPLGESPACDAGAAPHSRGPAAGAGGTAPGDGRCGPGRRPRRRRAGRHTRTRSPHVAPHRGRVVRGTSNSASARIRARVRSRSPRNRAAQTSGWWRSVSAVARVCCGRPARDDKGARHFVEHAIGRGSPRRLVCDGCHARDAQGSDLS